MFAALIKAAIFYFIFIQIRKFLRNSGVLPDSRPSNQNNPQHGHSNYQKQHSHQTTASKDNDVIEADYRIID